MKIECLSDVPDYQLCCGCGLCAYLHPDKIHMVDVPAHGRRPKFNMESAAIEDFKSALELCPALRLSHSTESLYQQGLIKSLTGEWGPVLEIWEGYATDPEIRFSGSSGGAMSAIALYCLEHEEMHGVLHTKADEEKPYLNTTTMSRTRDALLAASGSRYSPASPCEKLQNIVSAPTPCVFIGKPCDVAAVQNARQFRNELNEKVGLTMACFCAGTPSTNGTLEMLKHMDMQPLKDIVSLRYRGNGWPGKTEVAKLTSNGEERKVITYEQSWGNILQKYRQWRCYICPDHTGEFADIAIGDPWYREIQEREQGYSLLLVRSVLGKQIIDRAIATGYLIAEKANPLILPASQPGFPKSRAVLWGRLKALKLTNAPYPSYSGFSLAASWDNNLSLRDKVRVILGTVKRVYKKKLKEKQNISRIM